MAQIQQDPAIEQPLSSGATDRPDVVQHGMPSVPKATKAAGVSTTTDPYAEFQPSSASSTPSASSDPYAEFTPASAEVKEAASKPKELGLIDTANKQYEGTGVGNALGRLGMLPVNMVRSTYHAVADEPKNAEETAVSSSGAGVIPGRAMLAMKRLGYDPQAEEAKKVVPLAQQGRYSEAAGHAGAAALPMMGPYAANIGERVGSGDIAGGLTEAAGAIALPEVAREAMPGGRLPGAAAEGGRALPTVDAAVRGVSKAAGHVVPAAPLLAGATVGHPYIGSKILGGITEPLTNLVERGKVHGLSLEDAAHQQLEERATKSGNAAIKTQADVDKYKASAAQGVPPPEDVVKANEKAQARAAEDRFHADNAKEAAAKAKAARNAPKAVPEPATQQVAAQPQAPTMRIPGTPEAPVAPMNVKTPGQVQPETFPQIPTEKPMVTPGMKTLAGNQGTVGMRPMLTEGMPEAAPAEAPKAEAPAAPATMAKLGKPERGNLKTLKVGEGGKVTDTETPLDRQLREALKPGEAKAPAAEPKAPEVPEQKVRAGDRRQAAVPVAEERRIGERRNAAGIRVDEHGDPVMSPDVQGHWQGSVFGEKPAEDIGAKAREKNPEPTRAETKGEAAKPTLEKPVPATEPGLMKAGEEGREQPKSAAEYHPAVREQVTALPDEKLKQLAKAHGLNPDEYDFKVRDEGRHRTERDQLAEEVTKQMGDDEKINIGRNAEQLEHKAEMANKTKAERAASLFPRLRGPVDEYGNAAVAGGAPDDQLAEHEKNGGSTFSSDGKDLNGTNKYSVGAYPDRTEQVDKLTPERLEEFKKKNSDVLAKEDHAVGTWKDPDTGKSVLDVAKTYADRDEAIAAGKAANQKSIYDLAKGEEIKTGGTGEATPKATPETAKMSDAELLKHGFTREDIDAGKHLPTVSGAKALPTGDDLIKKYGESSGDPKDLTFILKDGRGVANTGVDHDMMLGGKATDKTPPREQFIADGNIRIRPHTGAAGREVSISIPESGINDKQLAYIQKMAPQLKSGAVLIEIGKRGGDWKTIPHGEATPEALGKVLNELAPMKNAKGSPIDEYGNPTVSGGSQAAGTAKAKELPALAEEHLTPEEKEGILKTPRKTEKFVENMMSMPKVQEFVDAAVGGQGARKWYQRSQTAVESIAKEAPEYFSQPGDHEKFTGLLAASSPRQAVAMNIREALGAWKEYIDAGRPEGKELEKLLRDNFTNKGGKTPNAMKALTGEPMWPDLTKNKAFKVPSFRDNLMGVANRVTNDGWMGLFSGIDARELSDPESYHPISVLTREAAKQLNWEPKEAQAAIWSFVKTFKEKGGETSPENIRHLSEDMADIVRFDPDTRNILKELKVNLDQLDKRIADNTGEKPEITIRPSFSSTNSARQLSARIKAARGEAPIPKDIGLFDTKPENEDTSFDVNKFHTTTTDVMEQPGKKKSPLKKM